MANTGSDPEKDTETFVSWSEFLASPYAPSLALVCLAVWLHAADSLIVATMLPSIVAEIGGAALVGWAVSLYEIGSIVAGAASALLVVRSRRSALPGRVSMAGRACGRHPASSASFARSVAACRRRAAHDPVHVNRDYRHHGVRAAPSNSHPRRIRADCRLHRCLFVHRLDDGCPGQRIARAVRSTGDHVGNDGRNPQHLRLSPCGS